MKVHVWLKRSLSILVCVAATACGGDSYSPTGGNGNGSGNGNGNGNGNGGGDPVETTSVVVRDDEFNPDDIVVSPGATVTWTWNNTSATHNVTWASASLPGSDTKSTGSHSVTVPATPGELVYYCTIHGSPNSGMRGTITIQ